MVDYIKVKDEENLARDPQSRAILNTDVDTLKAYKQRKQKNMMVDQLIQDNKDLKLEIQEIKALLNKIVGQNK
jgi:hypothetical protein